MICLVVVGSQRFLDILILVVAGWLAILKIVLEYSFHTLQNTEVDGACLSIPHRLCRVSHERSMIRKGVNWGQSAAVWPQKGQDPPASHCCKGDGWVGAGIKSFAARMFKKKTKKEAAFMLTLYCTRENYYILL